MKKTDYKKEFKSLYSAKQGMNESVIVPKMNFLKISGGNGPASQDWIDAIKTLYPVAYTIKFLCKKQLGQDFVVMPLEGLWWMEDMTQFSEKVKDQWLWSAMIMQPEMVTREIFETAIAQIKAKGKIPPLLDRLSFESYEEGRSAQVLHIGAYTDEAPVIQRLHEYIAAEGGVLTEAKGHHHEIYLSDARKTKPEKLKTILRQPY